MDRLSKAFIVTSAIGIAVAIYHGYGEITAYTGPGSTVCNIYGFLSCSSVFSSGDVTFPPGAYGLPLYVYGVVWFPLLTALGFWYGRKRGTLNGEVVLPLLMVGNLFTLYLWYVELGVIHALCPVCITLYLLNYIGTALAAKSMFGG
jgi:uncharacterized membrane protein